MSKSVLILGGTGFLGKPLSRELTKNKIKGTVRGREANILDLKKLEKEFQKTKFDYVINATGQITEPINNCLMQNSVGILNLIKCQSKYRFKLVQISSLLVYGSRDSLSEKSLLNPLTSYATCKAYADIIIKEFVAPKDFLIIRLSNLYGPNQTQGLIPYLLNSIKKNKLIAFNDHDGSLTRFFLHVNDAAINIVKFIKNDLNDVYNLIGPDKYNVKEIISLLNIKSNKPKQVRYSSLKPLGNINKIIESDKAKKLKYSYKYNLKDFLYQAIAFCNPVSKEN